MKLSKVGLLIEFLGFLLLILATWKGGHFQAYGWEEPSWKKLLFRLGLFLVSGGVLLQILG